MNMDDETEEEVAARQRSMHRKAMQNVTPFFDRIFDTPAEQSTSRHIPVAVGPAHIPSRAFKDQIRRETAKPTTLNQIPTTDCAPLPTRTAPSTFTRFSKDAVTKQLGDKSVEFVGGRLLGTARQDAIAAALTESAKVEVELRTGTGLVGRGALSTRRAIGLDESYIPGVAEAMAEATPADTWTPGPGLQTLPDGFLRGSTPPRHSPTLMTAGGYRRSPRGVSPAPFGATPDRHTFAGEVSAFPTAPPPAVGPATVGSHLRALGVAPSGLPISRRTVVGLEAPPESLGVEGQELSVLVTERVGRREPTLW